MANPTITINATGITVSGPLIAGEPVAVTASGLSLPEGAALTLALSSRAPNALLASCVLAESEETPGTWTGTLETASRQMAVYFATAAADDTRPAVLELVETTWRDSLALLVTSLRNSALIPSSAPCAVAPVYIPVPGPPGDPQPSDAAPQMDGTAAAGTSDEYARADHRHPTDTSRAKVLRKANSAGTVFATTLRAENGEIVEVFIPSAVIVPSTASGSNQLATAADIPSLSAYRTAAAQDAIDGAQDTAIAAKYTKPATGIPAGDLAAGVIPSVPSASDSTPQMDGTGAAGSATTYARGDHVHPTDTGKADKVSGATSGDLASLDGNGNLADSGKKVSNFVQKTGDQQMEGDLFVSREGSSPPVDYVHIGNTTGADAESFVAVANDGKQVSLGTGVGFDPAIITIKDGNPGIAKTPCNNGTLALQEGIAPAFSTSSTYAVGDYCTHEGLLHKCTTAVSTAGAWNAANWTAVSAMAEMPAPITVDSAMSSSSTNPVQNKVVNTAIDGRVPWTSLNETRALLWASNNQGTASGMRAIAIGLNPVATGNNALARGNTATASGNSTTAVGYLVHADAYASIALGFRAKTDGTNNAHSYAFVWQGLEAGTDYYAKGFGTFNINPTPRAGSTDPATGFYIGNDSLASLLRYAFASPTPSVSGTAATVACEDRAINDFTVATGITSLTITPPAAVTGRARDFFCRVTLTDSSLPTVTLSGETIDIGATEITGMTQGVNLLMFTEISSGHWLASRRSAS